MDIDIDCSERKDILEIVKHIPASMITGNKLSKHNSGVYFQNIPVDTESGISTIPFKTAEERGWWKMDFLNLHIYKQVKSEQHLIELMNREIPWDFFLMESFVVDQELLHFKDHFYVLKQMKPKSVEELAMCLALRLPEKRYLMGRKWEEIKKEIWIKTETYNFKYSHSLSYAHAVIVHMQLIIDNLMED